jgi:phosphopantetheine--protein transferase-like protein
MTTVQGIGIDAVEIARFTLWNTYSDKKLSRLFSTEEIAYCRACPTKSAERFAARFAAREALYKALCQAYPEQKWLFLRLCANTTISHGSHGQPELIVNWELLIPQFTQKPHILLSITHTDTLAIAWAMVQAN